jgi:uncharacterized protein YtpQ (UPF0354 family)
MTGAPLATFEHPHGAYSLRYPAHWETIVKEDGRSCGFGPRERDDVGLWISILPVSVDTEHVEMRAGVLEMMGHVAGRESISNIREDSTLGHFGFKGDATRSGDAGRYWLVLGGDLVLFASTQVPETARPEYEGPFDRVMASLRIHRDDALRRIQLTNELLRRLHERYPDQEYRYDESSPEPYAIRGKDRVIFAANLFRRVEADPAGRDELIGEFLNAMAFAGDDSPSAEELDAVRGLIHPVLKPGDYVRRTGPAANVVHREWLGDVTICYAIQGRKTLRFVLDADRERWNLPLDDLHEIALANLREKPFPESFPGAAPCDGRLVVLQSGDGFDASRILHPRLHEVFAPVLGTPFAAGIPDRGTLLLFSRRPRDTAARISAQIRKDFEGAAYPVSPRTFLIGPGGVRAAPD